MVTLRDWEASFLLSRFLDLLICLCSLCKMPACIYTEGDVYTYQDHQVLFIYDTVEIGRKGRRRERMRR